MTMRHHPVAPCTVTPLFMKNVLSPLSFLTFGLCLVWACLMSGCVAGPVRESGIPPALSIVYDPKSGAADQRPREMDVFEAKEIIEGHFKRILCPGRQARVFVCEVPTCILLGGNLDNQGVPDCD